MKRRYSMPVGADNLFTFSLFNLLYNNQNCDSFEVQTEQKLGEMYGQGFETSISLECLYVKSVIKQ